MRSLKIGALLAALTMSMASCKRVDDLAGKITEEAAPEVKAQQPENSGAILVPIIDPFFIMGPNTQCNLGTLSALIQFIIAPNPNGGQGNITEPCYNLTGQVGVGFALGQNAMSGDGNPFYDAISFTGLGPVGDYYGYCAVAYLEDGTMTKECNGPFDDHSSVPQCSHLLCFHGSDGDPDAGVE